MKLCHLAHFLRECISSFPLALQEKVHPSLTEVESPESVSSVCLPTGAQELSGASWLKNAQLYFLPLVLLKSGQRALGHVGSLLPWLTYILPKYNSEKMVSVCKLMLQNYFTI